MENNKSPGNDGLTKEFYCTFWSETKNNFMNSLTESKCLNALSTSQRKAPSLDFFKDRINAYNFFLIRDLCCYLMSTKNLYQKH